MKRVLLMGAALVIACPLWGQTYEEILDGAWALSQAEQARRIAEARAREEADENRMYWTCGCVGGKPVWGYKSLRQLRAETGAISQRSQALFDTYPQLTPGLNMLLSTLCK